MRNKLMLFLPHLTFQLKRQLFLSKQFSVEPRGHDAASAFINAVYSLAFLIISHFLMQTYIS